MLKEDLLKLTLFHVPCLDCEWLCESEMYTNNRELQNI